MPADVSLAHVSDSTLTIRLTRDDETRRIDGSAHDDDIIIIIIISVFCFVLFLPLVVKIPWVENQE